MLGILGLPCFTAEKRQRLDREPIDFFFCRWFLSVGTFFLNLYRISTCLHTPMKYGDLSAQSSDKHRLNCFLNQDYTGKAWKSWDCSAWRRKVQRNFIYKYFMEEIKRQSWTFLGSVQWVHKRWWASTEIQEILFKHEKKAFSLWEWPNSGTSCPERLFRPFELSKDTAGHNPAQPAFTYSALTREMN